MKNINKNQNILLQIDRKRHLFSVLLAVLTMLIISCEPEEEYVIPKSDTPEVSVVNDTITLDQKQASSTALTVNWTRGSNRGTDAAIDYTLQVASTEDFENPYELDLGRVIYTYNFTNSEINNLLLNRFGLSAGSSSRIFVRVKSIIADDAVDPELSNAAGVSVTPYEPVSGTLYLLGSATPNGWDAGNATEMSASSSDPGVFTYSGSLSNGELKFITDLGSFLPSYNKGEDDQSLFYRTDDAQPDEKFVIDQTGQYKVTVDLLDLSVSIEKLDQPPFTNIFIVGDAGPSGWNVDSPVSFIQSESDPFIFTLEGLLTPGEMKLLAGSTGDWCGDWYRPSVNGEPITDPTVEQNSGCDVDNKWAVTEETQGYYKITLDTREVTITFEKIDLYLIGDAGPNGWDISGPTPMDTNGEGVYTYSGPLTSGELKISKFAGNWCDGEWINSSSPDQAITNGDYIVTQGCDGPDNKWRVTDTTAGDYEIRVDLVNETITISPQ